MFTCPRLRPPPPGARSLPADAAIRLAAAGRAHRLPRSGSSTRTTRRPAPSRCAAGWSTWTACARAARRARRGQRHARQSRAVARLCRRARQACRSPSSSRTATAREKNAAMRALRRDADRARRGFRRGARRGRARSPRPSGLEFAPSFAPDLVRRRRDLCAGAVPRGAAARCALRADRARARASAAASWRATCWACPPRSSACRSHRGAGLCAVLRRGPRGDDATAPTRGPTAWRRACPTPAALEIIRARRGAHRDRDR